MDNGTLGIAGTGTDNGGQRRCDQQRLQESSFRQIKTQEKGPIDQGGQRVNLFSLRQDQQRTAGIGPSAARQRIRVP
jgi:hypothetical protein